MAGLRAPPGLTLPLRAAAEVFEPPKLQATRAAAAAAGREASSFPFCDAEAQRDPVVVYWPSVFLEAWGTKANTPHFFKLPQQSTLIAKHGSLCGPYMGPYMDPIWIPI